MNFDTIGGRRYVLVWALLIVATALLWAGKLTPDVWASVMQWSVGAYIVGNVWQRQVEAKAGKDVP